LGKTNCKTNLVGLATHLIRTDVSLKPAEAPNLSGANLITAYLRGVDTGGRLAEFACLHADLSEAILNKANHLSELIYLVQN